MRKLESAVDTEFHVLGVRVDAVQIPDVITQIEAWIALRDACRFIAVTGMHGVMEAQHDAQFKEILNSANLVVADGMPLVWLGRWRGFGMRRRVYGPELLEALCRETQQRPYRHYFYGGAPGVAEELAARLLKRFPNMQIAGNYSPPFRPLTEEEDREVVRHIEASRADIVWVGLSTPKQERWMWDHRDKLRVPVLIGVGAAFDFHTGRVSQAPRWMREHGFEWLFRLASEPRRLWRRYILYGSQFVWLVVRESLSAKKHR